MKDYIKSDHLNYLTKISHYSLVKLVDILHQYHDDKNNFISLTFISICYN